MQAQTHSPKFIRQRKFYTVLPVLALPFITLLFWALGGGKVTDTSATTEKGGFNFNLPDAYLQEEKKPLDKLGFYEQAEKDSLKMAGLMRSDPYYSFKAGQQQQADSNKLLGLATRSISSPGSGLNTSTYGSSKDPNEAKVYKKLEQLTATLNASTDLPQQGPGDEMSLTQSNTDQQRSAEISRLEDMMKSVEEQTGRDSGDLHGSDPEMKELNAMLEQILDIQHPERVAQRLKESSAQNKGQVFAVSSRGEENPVSILQQQDSKAQLDAFVNGNGFYSLDDNGSGENQNAIQAVVHETQELVNGSTVKLRLVNDVYINGVLIPKDNFLFGKASLSGERLQIQIESMRYGNSLFPVDLSVFDMDGMSGIHIPGAITRDAAKQSGQQAIQSVGVTSFDQSIGAQAASAGIELGRNLLSKKVKLIKVTVKAGYQVLLRDEKQVATR
jgi:conjugative transposon TraM protein